jgi:uncharacterized protein YbjT (DUF2867 family)
MILLIGATGNIGTELVKLLVAKGASLRVVSRDEKKVAQVDPRIERIIGDLHDPSVVQRALQGIGKLYTGHEGKAYDLTGPELLSTHDQVRILSKVVGKPIQCIDIPIEVAAESMRSNGLPEALIQSLSDLWIQARKNEGTFQTNEVERLTGKPAQTFETWCHEHREAFL